MVPFLMPFDTNSSDDRADDETAMREARLRRFLEQHIWRHVPEAASERLDQRRARRWARLRRAWGTLHTRTQSGESKKRSQFRRWL